MIRRIVLLLTMTAAVTPVLAQTPAPTTPVAVTPGPTIQGVPVQQADPQGFGGRGRRNRGDGQGFGGPGGERGFNRFGGGPAGQPNPNSLAGAPAPPGPALAAQSRAPAVPAAGPPALPADVQTMRSLQGSISAVFDPGAKSARIKLIETDDHGVEGVRTLKPGDLYRDGWRLGGVTATEATLRKGKSLLHVDFTRGWPAPAPIQPAVLVQPIVPQGPNGARGGPGGLSGQAGRRGAIPTPTPAAAAGLGLSNARVGGSPPSALTAQGLPPGVGPVNIRNNPDGSRTVTSTVNGQNIVVTLPAGGR